MHVVEYLTSLGTNDAMINNINYGNYAVVCGKAIYRY